MPTADNIIDEAHRWLGTPYRHQASVCGVGADCLGLVRGVYRELYGQEVELPPPYARYGQRGDAELLYAAALRHLTPVNEIEPACVLLFRLRRRRPARHIAIYTGAGRMVHAMTGVGVCELDYHDRWQRYCIARFSFPQVSS